MQVLLQVLKYVATRLRDGQELPVPKKKKLVTLIKKSTEFEVSGTSTSSSTQTPLQKLKSEIRRCI